MATKVNRIGLEPQIYKGGKTTLCAGCGHNAISERIIDAFYEMGIDPNQVVKAEIDLPRFEYSKPAQWTAFSDEFLRRLQAQPGLSDTAIGLACSGDHPLNLVGRQVLACSAGLIRLARWRRVWALCRK